MQTTADTIRIFTFPPGFGLPTTGPFSLKLAMALRMAGVPYEMCAGDLKKSPKRKIPWIEIGSTAMADSALVVQWLAEPAASISNAT
jgi:glutathione S-transferase